MKVALVANSSWNLYNFRRGLLLALLGEGHDVLLLSPDGPERAALEATGATFVPLKNLRRKGLNPLRDLALLNELRRRYRSHGVEVALHFTIKPVIYGSLASRLVGIRNISTLTGLGYTFISQGNTAKMAHLLYGIALRRADVVLFHNPDDLELFTREGLAPAERCRVVGGSGLELSDYPVVDYAEAIHGRFLFVGRLLVDKGVKEFVAAARLVKKERPDASFHILGPLDSGNPAGIPPAELDAWIREGTIIYDGLTLEVKPHLAKTFCIVLPSYREGLPRVLVEAGGAGRPSITTDVPGCRAVVTHQENGFLVPVRDAGALAQTMLEVLETPASTLAEMGLKSRKIVASNFDQDRVTAVYLDALNSL